MQSTAQPELISMNPRPIVFAAALLSPIFGAPVQLFLLFLCWYFALMGISKPNSGSDAADAGEIIRVLLMIIFAVSTVYAVGIVCGLNCLSKPTVRGKFFLGLAMAANIVLLALSLLGLFGFLQMPSHSGARRHFEPDTQLRATLDKDMPIILDLLQKLQTESGGDLSNSRKRGYRGQINLNDPELGIPGFSLKSGHYVVKITDDDNAEIWIEPKLKPSSPSIIVYTVRGRGYYMIEDIR